MTDKTTPISVKQKTYEIEARFLSPYAMKSDETKGRARQEPPCEFRTDFQRDRDRIIYSNSFKRLKNKTQVFFAPEGDHYVTRLTHTLDVAQISRSISRALSLNEDLAEAIALGHDLGHTPFGHVGERVLDMLSPTGFEHNVQSLRVVDVIEKDGRGLNLTAEVRDGILQHKSTGRPATLEGMAVSLADRIAYINHDIEDAIRAGILKEADLPPRAVKTLGHATRERINTAITDIYAHSLGKATVCMSEEVAAATFELRSFMFKNIYSITNKSMQDRAERMLSAMFEYFMRRPECLPEAYLRLSDEAPREQIICDYLSGMTDRYAINVFEALFIPENFSLGGVTV